MIQRREEVSSKKTKPVCLQYSDRLAIDQNKYCKLSIPSDTLMILPTYCSLSVFFVDFERIKAKLLSVRFKIRAHAAEKMFQNTLFSTSKITLQIHVPKGAHVFLLIFSLLFPTQT